MLQSHISDQIVHTYTNNTISATGLLYNPPHKVIHIRAGFSFSFYAGVSLKNKFECQGKGVCLS